MELNVTFQYALPQSISSPVTLEHVTAKSTTLHEPANHSKAPYSVLRSFHSTTTSLK